MIDPIRTTSISYPQPVARGAAEAAEAPVVADGFSRSESQTPTLNRLQAVEGAEEPAADYPRPMTRDEKKMFKSWFPALDVEKSQVTAEATPRYNCISWTTGNTSSWDWPPSMYPESSPQEAFRQYYTERGFSSVSAEQAGQIGKDKELVAYWEDPNGPTHGSVSGPSHGERWESKCGQAAQIQHGQDELESDVYGKIAGFWLKTGEGEKVVREIPPEAGQRLDTKLALKIVSMDPKVVDRFEKAYANWQTERSSAQVAVSSNPADYTRGKGYQEMLSLGKEALPLWVQKMREGDFFCQYAVQQLTRPAEGDFQIKGPNPQPELKAGEVRCSEQDKANQIMVQWLDSQW